MALVFTVQADAQTFSSAVDVRLGYPKAGVDIGGGRHVPPAQSITARYGNVDKHPSLSQWRYPDDVPVETELGKGLPLPGTGSKQTLDTTWFPAAPTDSAAVKS